jgi:dephospho-CoA kinase
MLLIFPIVLIGSQCEKRYLVRFKQPLKAYCKVYRIVNLILLFMYIRTCVPRTRGYNEDNKTIQLFLNELRYIFILLGIHLGQAYCPIAITGSIATGKSTVVKSLLEKYAASTTTKATTNRNTAPVTTGRKMFRIIDTDKIAHDILLSPSRLSSASSSLDDDRVVHTNDSIYTKILNTFGDKQVDNKNILNEDNEIDRRKLGDVIFQDRTKRHMLNRIAHPQIIRILIQQLFIGTYLRKELWICADVPLLYETTGKYTRYLFGCVVVVACSPDVQYERLRKRNPDLTETQCRQRIASQMPIDQKASRADIVIWNDGSYDDLSMSIQGAINELRQRMEHGQFSWLQYYILVAVGLFSYPILLNI